MTTKNVDLKSLSLCDGTQIVAFDPWLEPYRAALQARHQHFLRKLVAIEEWGGLLGNFSCGHHYYGVNRATQEGTAGYWYREWAPGAQKLSLIGDFNDWNPQSAPMTRDQYGVWSVFVDDPRFVHGSRFKVRVESPHQTLDRIPAYARRVTQSDGGDYAAELWQPPTPYNFRHPSPQLNSGLRIYEAHVGMAEEEPRVGSFREFTLNILPRVKHLGYNAIQLMAIMEHPYYGSFGYQVSNFFAVSSRFGTPDDLKELIDTAHGLGIQVLLDLVHSHSVDNTHEGLNLFDGTDFQYFHAGPRGKHTAWGSMLFDYAKPEILRFLLSNIRYWIEEFRFDGFRFDGVTSMLYLDHGLGRVFTCYDDYFGPGVDEDAVTYLKLANLLVHIINPRLITIAEDVSGMAGLARPVEEGGEGFDYRLSMGVPDFWIKTLKEKSDEEWNLNEIYQILLNRRRNEMHVGYAESHDQALVGDQTIAFRLLNEQMYWNMSKTTPSPIVDRGLALHKLIRLITFSLAGEAWLSFMGNEFGHPEWIDFPRAGNQFSYQHARRLWSLADRSDLRYHGLLEFDRALQELDQAHGLLLNSNIGQLLLHEHHKQLAYYRGELVFIFNFHCHNSYSALRVPVPENRDYRVVLDSDEKRFEGHGHVTEGMRYPVQSVGLHGFNQSVEIYLPARSAQVLAPWHAGR